MRDPRGDSGLTVNHVSGSLQISAKKTYAQHDGQRTELSDTLSPLALVDAPLEAASETTSVGTMAFSALYRQNLALLVDLVGGREHALLKEYLLDANLKLVASGTIGREGQVWVAIEEGLGSNVAESMVKLTLLCKDSIEGLNMGIDGRGEGRVCRLV